MKGTNITEMVKHIQLKEGGNRENIKRNLELYFEALREELEAGNKIKLGDIGVIEMKTQKARTARNPRTGETIEVPEKKTLKFKPFRQMLENINK